MPRTSPLGPDELIAATVLIRKAHDLPAFNQAIRDVYLSVFQPEMTFFYHFFDGGLHVPLDSLHNMVPGPADLEDFLQDSRSYDPVDVKRRGRLVHHSSELYRWYEDKPEMMKRSYERSFATWGCDWMLSIHFFEGDIFLGCAGMAQRWDSGDFSDYDIQALEMLHPFLEEGFHECCRNSRNQLFGKAMAQAIEYHPSGLFLFNGDDIFYSNAAGRTLLQHEDDGQSRFPMTRRSKVIDGIRAWLRTGEFSLRGIRSLETVDLPAWPALCMKQVRLVVADRQQTTFIQLSARQKKILQTVAALETQTAAEQLGISIQTLHTHLRNIYRKLGVSGLNEALVLAYLTAD
jgi:DNA-binding CsgD family transcriptional regulator